jgi:hypothetical protein
MNWTISYFNEKVRKQVMSLPAGILADYVRLTDAMAIHGADLRMPHSRAMGGGRDAELRLARQRLKDVQNG